MAGGRRASRRGEDVSLPDLLQVIDAREGRRSAGAPTSHAHGSGPAFPLTLRVRVFLCVATL